jgi:xylulokinase
MRGGRPAALLGLDVGTTTVKALLLDPEGTPVGVAVVPYSGGRAPDEPEGWWTAVSRAVGSLGFASRDVAVAGVGVCGRGSGLALLDARGEAIAIPWPKVRAGAARLPLSRTRRFRRVALWGRLLAAARRVAPSQAARIARVLPVKDYVAYRLTGIVGTDPPSAACGAWPRTSGRLGVPGGLLPPIRPSASRLGRLGGAAAARLGLPSGVAVAVGTHDGVAANLGAAMLRPGEGCLTLGTHAVVRVNTRRPVDGRWTVAPFTYPFIGGGFTSGGDVPEAGAAMARLVRCGAGLTPAAGRRRAGVPSAGAVRQAPADGNGAARFFAGHAALDTLAARVPPGAGGLRFLPDAGAGAALVGLRPDRGTGHVARAIMEGVAMALADVLDGLAWRGYRPRALCLTGGGARSRLWAEIVAAVVGRPLGLVAPEASARGAAILAAAAAGVWPDVATAARRMVRPAGRVRPAPGLTRIYAQLRAGRAAYGTGRGA